MPGLLELASGFALAGDDAAIELVDDAGHIGAGLMIRRDAVILVNCGGTGVVGSEGEGDVVVVAGKGHETGQLVGDKILPFSDHDEVRSALSRLPT